MTAPDDDGPDSGRAADDSGESGETDQRSAGVDDVAGPAPHPSAETGSETPARERRAADRRGRPGEHSAAGSDSPTRRGSIDSGEESEDDGGWRLFARDVVTSVAAVALLGGYLFAISGVWPPMVAIESGSMAPNMEVDDLVVLMDNERFPPEEAHAGTGVVTAAVGNETGYGNYGGDGDVIVFEPDGNAGETPIIHRAMFWVEEGENWCERADPAYLGAIDGDDESCVAPNDGFITRGDGNSHYDQARQLDRPVKPEWVVGTAELRVPRLGWFRLQF